MAVLVCPGSCAGAIAFKRAAGLALDDEPIAVGETSTLPYAVRVIEPGRDQRLPQAGRRGVPRRRCRARAPTGSTTSSRDVCPAVEKAESVFQTTLQNGNPVIHPAVTLLNAGLIERTGGDFLFYEEGVTESRRAADRGGRPRAAGDRRGARRAVLSEPASGVKQGYMLEANYSTGYSTAPGFLGIGARASSTTAT